VTSADEPGTVAYTAPDADEVPELTGELVRWLNEGDLDTPALVRAAMAHVRAGWLEARGEAQARYYVAGEGFPGDIRLIAARPSLVRDPYAEAARDEPGAV
jgi:hypothetical protein